MTLCTLSPVNGGKIVCKCNAGFRVATGGVVGYGFVSVGFQIMLLFGWGLCESNSLEGKGTLKVGQEGG